jgi:AGZA family xanthine/uracil permease-like MFS transporter
MVTTPRFQNPEQDPTNGRRLGPLDRFFHLSERGTNFRTELLAGLTTFSTLSYILVVNPNIMVHGGFDFGAMVTATAVVGAIFTVMMGLWTNYPLAMAPAMGINAMIAIQVCQIMRIPWQAALGFVFYAGVGFFILSVSGIRQIVIEAFPDSYKKIITSSIGFFIAYVGFQNGHLIVPSQAGISTLGDFTKAEPLVAFLGIVVTLAAVMRKVPGALILSILVITLLGFFLPGMQPHTTITPWPKQLISFPNSMSKVAFHVDFGYTWLHPGQSFLVISAILFGDLFSAMGCLFAVGRLAGLLDANGNLPKLKQALTADATAAMGGAMLGTNTPIIYIESAAGIEQGGRTGLVSIVVAICYLLALFLTPIISIVPSVATTPALTMIGIFMMQGMAELDLRDLAVAGTALVTTILVVLGSSADGIVLGFVVNVVLNILIGKREQLTLISYGLAAFFMAYYIFIGGPGH